VTEGGGEGGAVMEGGGEGNAVQAEHKLTSRSTDRSTHAGVLTTLSRLDGLTGLFTVAPTPPSLVDAPH